MFSNTMRRKFALTGLTLGFLFVAAKPAGAETILGSGSTTVRIQRLDASGRVIDDTTVEVQFQRLDLRRMKLPSGTDVAPRAADDTARAQLAPPGPTRPQDARSGECVVVYDNTDWGGFWYESAFCPSIDYGFTEGGVVCAFTIGYHTEASSPGPIILRFFISDPVNPPPCPGDFLTAYSLTGLPGNGTYAITFSLSPQAQFELPFGAVEYVYEFDNSDTFVLLASGGSANENAMYNCQCQLFWFGGNPWAGLYMRLFFGPESSCGNGVVDPGEDCSNCPQDVQCPPGTECIDGICQSLCGNGVVDPGENCSNCPQDVQCPPGTECVDGMCESLCGNGVVDPGENCSNCPQDVQCPPGTKCIDGMCELSCPADLDGSGDVGVKDLLFLLGAWGPCPPKGDCPADFDISGDVGVKDLLSLLGAWGPCP